MEKIGYVYLTTNLVNGKQYVGQHLHDDFDAKYKGSGHYIKNAFEKYGWNNFDCKVICWCTTQTQLNEAEDNYIKLLDTMVPNGYNLKRGGAKGKFSKEAKENVSKGTKMGMLKPQSRKKNSESKKRFYESEMGLNLRKQISESRKKWFENEENRKKHSKNQLNNPKKSKKVLQFTKDGKFVKLWVSISEIQRVLGYDYGTISKCCNGKLKTSHDFIWKFSDNNQQETPL